MQNIILFIEPTTSTHYLPSKIGHMFINRFAIDEEEKSEILKIFELQDKIRDLALKKGKGHRKKESTSSIENFKDLLKIRNSKILLTLA